MPSATELAARLSREIAGSLGVQVRDVEVSASVEAADEDGAGIAELTGPPEGPGLPVPGQPVRATRAAIAVASTYLDADLPGVEVLGERARIMGLKRNAPMSAGGAFRVLRSLDGWFGLSLSRMADVELLPALVEGDTSDPWAAAAKWIRTRTNAEAAARVALLGMPGAPVPSGQLPERRAPVLATVGGPRRRPTARPRVIDLTALWAGPLCARFLALGGARVVKVESSSRPDPVRSWAPTFYEYLHDGCQLVRIDFMQQRDRLVELIESADVVLEGSRPRALRQLGIEAMEYVERGTVWVGLSAYGRGQGDEDRVGFGDDVAAGAGLVTHLHGRPVPVGDAIADPLAGVHAAAAAAIALCGARGALLDVSMHDTARRAAAA